jgi:RNA polymerase-binding transcription factor DksA
MRFDDDTRALLRRRLLDRGQVLATLLAAVLAGKDKKKDLAAIGLDAKPGMKPEEVLRAALEHVERLRKQVEAGDDAYGRCHVCAKDLGAAAMLEVPWADACAAHAGLQG